MESLFEVAREDHGFPWEVVRDDIRSEPAVTCVQDLPGPGERIVGIARCDDCGSCRALAASGCFLTHTQSRDGYLEWTVRCDDSRKLSRLVEELRGSGMGVDVVRLAPMTTSAILTARQEEALKCALEMGYFEFPKRVGIEEVAGRLGVAKSTLSEILHRGEKRILRWYVERGS